MAKKSFANGALYARAAHGQADRDEACKIFGFLGTLFVMAIAIIPAIIYFAQ